jgi:hypothetical protein
MHVRKAHLGAMLAGSLWMTACAYGINARGNEAGAVTEARNVTFFVQARCRRELMSC